MADVGAWVLIIATILIAAVALAGVVALVRAELVPRGTQRSEAAAAPSPSRMVRRNRRRLFRR